MLWATENGLTMHVKNPNGGDRGVGYLARASIGHGQLGQGYRETRRIAFAKSVAGPDLLQTPRSAPRRFSPQRTGAHKFHSADHSQSPTSRGTSTAPLSCRPWAHLRRQAVDYAHPESGRHEPSGCSEVPRHRGSI
jgi:hypothetical protein